MVTTPIRRRGTAEKGIISEGRRISSSSNVVFFWKNFLILTVKISNAPVWTTNIQAPINTSTPPYTNDVLIYDKSDKFSGRIKIVRKIANWTIRIHINVFSS